MEINTEICRNLTTNGFFEATLTDIISIILGLLSLIVTILTLQTAKSLKRKIYENDRCDHLIKKLNNYKKGIKRIESSANEGLQLAARSLQKDLGACIIELKDSKPLLLKRHIKKIDSLEKQYQSVINYLSKQESIDDICLRIMKLCQETNSLVDDIILKLESEKI